MNPYKVIADKQKAQCTLFFNNYEEILDSNLRTLRYLMALAFLVLSFCLSVSLFIAGYEQRRAAYLIAFFFWFLLCLFFFQKRSGWVVLAGLYCIFGIFLGLTIYMSVQISPGYMATSVIGLFCLMPPAILDRSWRVNLIMLLFFCVHLIFSWCFKIPKAAADDTVNGICFILIGTLFGEYMRNIKLENYEMKRQAQRQMEIDFLTGLYNRRKMFELLEKQKISCKGRRLTGLIMLDIDHFKEYNDQFGHLAGDECLRQLGNGLGEFGRKQGLDFFRYGGEEFLAFCYESSGGDAKSMAEAIRNLIWDLNITYPGSHRNRVTISLGFAEVTQNGGSIDDGLISMADQALYQAKSSGRNCAVSFG